MKLVAAGYFAKGVYYSILLDWMNGSFTWPYNLMDVIRNKFHDSEPPLIQDTDPHNGNMADESDK